MIKTFLNPSNKESNRIATEEYNRVIGDAEKEFEQGEYITHEEMLKKIREW